ncbi:TD and POZ domain-containing protein 2 [Araneus ventricosus]|uniref:TD and POZ domain-containing protein 2 n=1 Tax=Araneus ventricosus TaxID=182803 RepID=A0A4Y2KGR9_ARAVE|nr:TD and POZ domain-containing protein 2 [Araneus ventricosus]
MMDVRQTAFEVKWSIENIKSWLQKRNDTLYSPQFLTETLTNTRWKLSLSPNWQLAEKYLSLTLQRDVEDNGPNLIDLRYELSFLRSDGSPLKSKSCTKKFAPETISHELKVKQVEILAGKKEAYLLEGVLTVCCKLWNTWSTISKEGQCSSLRSVIGTKCINLNATIDNFSLSSSAIVNFLSPSTDINLISLDVYASYDEFVFQRKYVECKSFSWYSFKLFALDASGYRKEFNEKNCLASHLPLANQHTYLMYQDFCSKYLPNKTLTLQLEVSYHPGIISECAESEFHNYENLSCEATDLENLTTSDSEKVCLSVSDCLHSSNPCNVEESQSSDEDKCLATDGKRYLPLTTLKEDMASLYNNPLFCDMKLRTDTKTFPAHRSVLCARSPEFKKMFTTDMKEEKADECIEVQNISSDTLSRMLQFIYTDCAGDLEMKSAKDLYIASIEYKIASLKQCCSSFMKKNLCPSNVCEVLVLADMHQDKDLESIAQEYVLSNDKEVFYSEEWKLFIKNYGSLAAQVMLLKFTKE